MTLSDHLAVQAQMSGAGPVCLIDIDPQGSLADWWNEREADMPTFAFRRHPGRVVRCVSVRLLAARKRQRSPSASTRIATSSCGSPAPFAAGPPKCW